MKPGIQPLRGVAILVLVAPILVAAWILGSDLAWVVITERGGGFSDPSLLNLVLGSALFVVFSAFAIANVVLPVAVAGLWFRKWPSDLRRRLFLVAFWLVWIQAVVATAVAWHPVVPVLAVPSIVATMVVKLEDYDAPAPIPRLEEVL